MAAAAVQPPPSAANAFMLETLPDMTKNSETTTQPVTGNKEVALVTSDGGGDAGGRSRQLWRERRFALGRRKHL